MAAAGAIHEYDVAVIGGGPAGSAAAARLARRGRRVLVLERERFPRFHIGESQLPWIDGVLRAIGAEDRVRDAGFVVKWGASFTDAAGTVEQYADFTDAAETPCPQTWQVPRDEFDRVLLEHAATSGADVRQGAAARDAAFDANGVTVAFTDASGSAATARVAAVVDASGRSGFLARRFAGRRYDAVLRNVAVHAQYAGIPRRAGRRAGDIRMVTRPDRGWFWFIPISPTVTSVGVVLPKDAYARFDVAGLDEGLARRLAETPAAAALVREAERISPARFDADYSYDSERLAGDRWVLAGDAGAFLDPIFSTGVLMALQSGIESADAIDAGLAAGDLSRRRFAAYERTVGRRYRHFRRFAVGFYDPAFRDFFFASGAPFGMRQAVISVMAGNWRPSLATRLRLRLFFTLVAIQRHVRIVPRLGETTDGRDPVEIPAA